MSDENRKLEKEGTCVRHSFDSIDIAKFVGSIFVFAMHCSAFGNNSIIADGLEMLARWCVPFFFICSSYLLFRKKSGNNIDKNQMRHFVFRIGALHLLWLIFNLPSVYYLRIYSKHINDINGWLVFLKNSILSSTFTGSWYLNSCIFSVIYVYLFSKRFRTNSLIIISLFFYILCVLSSNYRGLLAPSFRDALDWWCFPLNIFSGCLYFSVGKYIAENETTIVKTLNKKKAIILFLLLYLLYILEVLVAKYFNIFGTTDIAFATAGMAFMLFLFIIQVHTNAKYARLLRKMSVVIYCCQSNILLINSFCKRAFGLSPLIAFFLSAIVVSLVSFVVIILQRKTNWKWVNYLT